MLKITDRTLSCVDMSIADTASLLKFLSLLIKCEVDYIELSEEAYKTLSPPPDFHRYVLRVNNRDDCDKYPSVSEFVCRNESAENIRAEIILNDAREAYTIARYADCRRVRITGLDDCLTEDYLHTFAYLRKAFRGDIEFCPGNRFYCAAALATEWVTSGTGKEIVTSFGGTGGFAPTEEVVMSLRLQRLRKVTKTYEFFPEMAGLLYKITGKAVSENKPVTGGNIFRVESGIHVDGILKQPKCYEPFPPETVGLKREIVLGKQSGAASVRAKSEELGIRCEKEQIPLILQRVKTLGAEKNGAVTNEEFAEIARLI